MLKYIIMLLGILVASCQINYIPEAQVYCMIIKGITRSLYTAS